MSTENKTTLKKLSFSNSIKAPKEKVWKTLWDDKTYGPGQVHLQKDLMQKVTGTKAARFYF